ncbi:MAG TPA: GDSL-type esterase/lipase family protein [Solirubrobacteraceae bacterium]|jgi:lysophospholipase L1-like esterase
MPYARIAAVCLAALAVAAAPAAARQKPVTRGSTYLALGDSVPFGYQESGVVPAPDYAHARNFTGYPELVGQALHLRVANAACPGETSASLVNAAATSNGCENAYRKSFPLHVRYKGSQLAYAVKFLKRHRNTRLVTLMVGANDYFLCQKATADSCGSAAEQSAVLTKIAANVRKTLSRIRNTARYRGQIAIVSYYSFNYSSPAVNALSQALNTRLRKAARSFHVVMADGFGTFRAGAAHAGGSPCVAGLLTQLGSPGTCGIHPSYAGQSLLAQAVMKAIRTR